MRWERSLIVVVIIIVSFLFGYLIGYTIKPTQAPSSEGIVIIDDLGRQVVLEQVPKRIISVAAAATRTLYDLGMFSKVIGVDKYSDDPPEAKNKTIVDYKNAEQLLNMTPDLIIAWWYQRKYLEVLEDKVPIIYIHPTSIDGIYYDIWIIGKATGAEEKAQEIISNLKACVAYIEEVVKNLTKQYGHPKVYVELYSPYKTIGRNTFTHEMIELAGGINIAGNLTGYPLLSDEYIINANPDVILYENFQLSPDNFTSRPGWNQINAVKNGKIYYLDRHIATASPRFVEGLKFMVWAFFGYNISSNISLCFSNVSSHIPSDKVSVSECNLLTTILGTIVIIIKHN